MKRIFGLALIAACFLSLFAGCAGGSNVKVESTNDTINYAFGAANGFGIKKYMMGDTATEAQITAFVKGFDKMFFNEDPSSVLETEGFRMGNSMKNELKSGYLFNDSSIAVNMPLVMQVFEDAIRGNYFMAPDSAMADFQRIMASSMSSGESANLTKEQADSINRFFALINGHGARRYLLNGDTTENDIKNFLSGINKGMESAEDVKSYVDGISMASNMTQQLKMSNGFLFGDSSIEMKHEIIKKGIMEALSSSPEAIMTGEQAQDYINKLFESLEAKRNKVYAEKGEAFLAENATKEGVVVTESGLQYKVITMGNGPKPTSEDRVKVHYHGTLIDGTVFDSSIERGEPIEFPLNGVIKGWTEGLQLMPVGSKFILYIPYQLAYGTRGSGDVIGPCEALIFEVELLDIVK